jgi:hypothetical protein
MGYVMIGLIGFGLGFLTGAAYAYIFGEESAEARSQGTSPEKENTDRASADSTGDNNE